MLRRRVTAGVVLLTGLKVSEICPLNGASKEGVVAAGKPA